MHFYRTVTPMRTDRGTKYVEIAWWSGKYDISVNGVTFRNLTTLEYIYFRKQW